MANPQVYKHIPSLRFPEFVNDGEWDYVPGNELFAPIVNKNHNSDLPVLAITQDQGAVPRELIDYNVIVSDKSIAGYKVVEIGDFIISLRSFQGGIEYSNYKGLCSPAYIVLRRKNDSICNDFYRHYFKSKKYIQDLNRNLEGIRDGKMISYQQFSEIKIPFPPLAEQKRIAECLSSIDNMITECNNKLEQLKCHKKGLMQQLFASINGGGNSLVPRLRFPEFNNTKEWEVKKLGDICTFLDNKRIPLKDSERAKIHGRYPYYGASGIIDYVNNYIFDGEYILLSEDGANIILRNSPLAFIIKGKCWVNNHAHVLETKAGNNIYYVCHLLESMNYESLNTGTAQPKLNRENCEKIELPIPSFEEQCKIAESLNSIDNMVISYSDKMTMLQQHKKGLMQQMFPNDQMN
ncbi:MAG: restriction endonuclease subunit S [Prevotella sp.]|nr:restriction endonuclease subunit S [Prevotella sp.]